MISLQKFQMLASKIVPYHKLRDFQENYSSIDYEVNLERLAIIQD